MSFVQIFSQPKPPSSNPMVPDHWFPKDETVSGFYGGFGIRQSPCRHFWNCGDSDYRWHAIVDDFGDLVPVTFYTCIQVY